MNYKIRNTGLHKIIYIKNNLNDGHENPINSTSKVKSVLGGIKPTKEKKMALIIFEYFTKCTTYVFIYHIGQWYLCKK